MDHSFSDWRQANLSDDGSTKADVGGGFDASSAHGRGDSFQNLGVSSGQASQDAAFSPYFSGKNDGASSWQEGSDGDVAADPPPDLQEIERKVREEAAAEGERKGFENGMQQAREIVDRLEAILSSVEAGWSKIIEAYESEIIQLVARVSEKVVFGQVRIDASHVKEAILNAFEVIPHPLEVTLYVNPEDYEYIETVKQDFFAKFKQLKHMSVISDPATDRGGCKIITGSGEVDATLESRLAAIQKSIMEAG